MSRDWRLYLDDLIDSAEKITRFLQDRTFDALSSDEMLFDAVLFNLEVIGEAVQKLPEEPKASAPEADWTGPDARPDRASLLRRRSSDRLGSGHAARSQYTSPRQVTPGSVRPRRHGLRRPGVGRGRSPRAKFVPASYRS